MMNRGKRTIAVAILLLLFLMVGMTIGERSLWDCPGCGRKGNTGNFCGNCVHPAPWIMDAINTSNQKETDNASFRTVGSIVKFGKYEQDNNLSNGPEDIEWIVLDVQNGKSLLLSKYLLDAKPYNDQWTHVTWKDCTLRRWLNRDFVNAAFSAQEQSSILLTDVDNSKKEGYSKWSNKSENNTKDKIFLLSYHEAFELYFKNDNERISSPTDYAIANGAYISSNYNINGKNTGWWWLRSPGISQSNVANVNTNGSIFYNDATHEYGCVRPALWIDLDSDYLTSIDGYNGKTDRGEKNTSSFNTVGSIVKFGKYEQDNNISNGPEDIEWIVLDVQERKSFLLSKYLLDAMAYNDQFEEVTWEECTLRRWLNKDFLNSSFTMKEQTAILLTEVDNSISQGYRQWVTDSGNNTQDKVILLSYHEVYEQYFKNDTERISTPTDYAIANGAYTSNPQRINGRGTGWWWLRSPGSRQDHASNVINDGSIYYMYVNNGLGCVRPALWINLDSGIF